MPRRRRPKGERRHGRGWQVYVRVNGELRWKQFPLDSTPEARHAWRVEQQHTARPIPPVGSLGRDAVRWLRSVKHTPDYVNKRIYVVHWLQALGRLTPRAAITAPQIATVMSDWLYQGYSPITVRHHRTALLKVWEFCDGRAAVNPVRDTPRPSDPEPEVRAAKLEDIQAVIARLRPGKTQARLRLMLATGLPHRQIMQLTPDAWDRDRRLLRVTRRNKGRGTAGRYLPLSDAATAALEAYDRESAWGRFSPSAMHSAVHRACKALGLPPFRPYDIRHFVGAQVYAITGDLPTTARLLGHSDVRTASRYAAAAFAEVDRVVMERLGRGEREHELTGDVVKPEKEPGNEKGE